MDARTHARTLVVHVPGLRLDGVHELERVARLQYLAVSISPHVPVVCARYYTLHKEVDEQSQSNRWLLAHVDPPKLPLMRLLLLLFPACRQKISVRTVIDRSIDRDATCIKKAIESMPHTP